MSFNYWEEAVASSFDEHGISATDAQIAAIAKDMEGARECIGMAFHVPEDPSIRETERLNKLLKAEREKITCRPCNGRGSIEFEFMPGRFSLSQCDKCHGDGRHAP